MTSVQIHSILMPGASFSCSPGVFWPPCQEEVVVIGVYHSENSPGPDPEMEDRRHPGPLVRGGGGG